ncbi:MAG: endonuclease/exonuclease/phosphatase family protein [Planctomycetaceae bacterium]
MQANDNSNSEVLQVEVIKPTWAEWSQRQCHWIAVLLVLPAIAGVVGNMTSQFWWVSDLTTHFQWQATCYSCAVLVIALLGRNRVVAVVVFVAFLWHGSFVAPMYWGGHRLPPKTPTAQFKAMTFNVYAGKRDPELVDALIQQELPDVLCVEELTTYWHAHIKEHFAHHVAIPTDGAFGGGIYSPHEVTDVKEIYLSDQNTSLQATLQHPEGPITVIVVHCFPCVSAEGTRLRNKQIKAIQEHVSTVEGPVLVMGDFNSSPWTAPMRSLIANTQLHSSLRGAGPQCSWPAGNLLLRTPIDHVFGSPELEFRNRRVGPASGSDHLPVIVDCIFSTPHRD